MLIARVLAPVNPLDSWILSSSSIIFFVDHEPTKERIESSERREGEREERSVLLFRTRTKCRPRMEVVRRQKKLETFSRGTTIQIGGRENRSEHFILFCRWSVIAARDREKIRALNWSSRAVYIAWPRNSVHLLQHPPLPGWLRKINMEHRAH